MDIQPYFIPILLQRVDIPLLIMLFSLMCNIFCLLWLIWASCAVEYLQLFKCTNLFFFWPSSLLFIGHTHGEGRPCWQIALSPDPRIHSLDTRLLIVLVPDDTSCELFTLHAFNFQGQSGYATVYVSFLLTTLTLSSALVLL